MSRVQSESWTCPNGHFGNVVYGDAEETWGDTECPVCGAAPGDKLDPDVCTGDAPGLDDWIADNNPGCQECGVHATFLYPDEREDGFAAIRWQCPLCNCLLTNDGLAVNEKAYLLRQELAAKAGEKVAADD